MLLLFAATAITQMSCLDRTCAALRDDRRVLIWGRHNPVKELKSDTPREVPGLTGVKQVAAGGDFCLALLQDGTVQGWGTDGWGQCGDGKTGNDALSIVTTRNLTGVASIGAIANGGFA